MEIRDGNIEGELCEETLKAAGGNNGKLGIIEREKMLWNIRMKANIKDEAVGGTGEDNEYYNEARDRAGGDEGGVSDKQ